MTNLWNRLPGREVSWPVGWLILFLPFAFVGFFDGLIPYICSWIWTIAIFVWAIEIVVRNYNNVRFWIALFLFIFSAIIFDVFLFVIL